MNGKIDYNELIGEGEKGMVSVFQETWNEGEAKGIIEMGNDFGLSEEDILARLQKKLNVSLQKAQEYLYAFLALFKHVTCQLFFCNTDRFLRDWHFMHTELSSFGVCLL